MFALGDIQRFTNLNVFFMKTSINSIYLYDKLAEIIYETIHKIEVRE